MKLECDLYFGWVLCESADFRQLLEALLEMANSVALAMRLGLPGENVFKVVKQGRGDRNAQFAPRVSPLILQLAILPVGLRQIATRECCSIRRTAAGA